MRVDKQVLNLLASHVRVPHRLCPTKSLSLWQGQQPPNLKCQNAIHYRDNRCSYGRDKDCHRVHINGAHQLSTRPSLDSRQNAQRYALRRCRDAPLLRHRAAFGALVGNRAKPRAHHHHDVVEQKAAHPIHLLNRLF